MNKETKGNNLLLPLALGGGLLLLFMSMKSKAQDNPNLLPPKEIEPEADQIIPDEAPKYTSLPSTTSSEEDFTEDAEQSPAPPANKYIPPAYTPSSEEESEDYADASRTGNDADSSEDWEQDDTDGSYKAPLQTQTKQDQKFAARASNNKMVKLDKMRSEQNKKFAERGAVSPQGIRSYSDQNRKFAEHGGIVQNAKVNKLNSMRSFSDQAKLLTQQKAKNAPRQTPTPLPVQANAGSKIFPLKQGQTNNYIKEVQRKLGVSATGFFGTQTRAALLKKYKVTEIRETLYKQIISGKASIAKPITPIKKLVKPLYKAKPKVNKKITKVVPKKTVKRK